MPHRTVFFVSDGTGITAETFGNAILAQFEMKAKHVRLPFVDSADKAHQAVRQINHTATAEGLKPIVFTTLVNMEILKIIEENCRGMLLDMFGMFVHPLEKELGLKSNHRVGRFSDASKAGTKPHRGHQLLAGARRWPIASGSGAFRCHSGGRQPQRENTHLALSGHAIWAESLQLPADSRGL